MIRDLLAGVGLLILRVGFGLMMLLGHGWGKLTNFPPEQFFDPFGLGVTVSAALAIFAEVFCAALIVLGLGTRLAAVPLVITMAVAAFMFHGDDPLFMSAGKAKEPALIYLTAFLTLFFTGGGFLSLDRLIGMFLNDRKVRAGKKS